MQINLCDKAYYYLQAAQKSGNYDAIIEFMDCLCMMNSRDAMGYILDVHKKAKDMLAGYEEQQDEALADFFCQVNRRMILLMITKDDLDEAERILKDMVEHEYDVEYAKYELERVDNLRKRNS